MAEASGNVRSADLAVASRAPGRTIFLPRLVLGAVSLLGVFLFVFGTSWDIQWHEFVGRDRTLIPPHDLMLGGIVLCGVTALASVGVETTRAARDPAMLAATTAFAGAFHAPLGAYLVGFGALAASIGLPLDAYWHALYGIDVSIWAPFHVMILMGMAAAALGTAYMLRSSAVLAARAGQAARARAGELGTIVALGLLTSMLLLFLDAALANLYLVLAGLRVSVFPLMLGAFGMFPLAVALRSVPWPRAATAAVVVYYALDLVTFLAIPPLTNALVVAEHQTYRVGPPHVVVVSLVWPLSLIVAGVLLDVAAGYARRRRLRSTAAYRPVLAAAVAGTPLVAVLDPFFVSRALARGAGRGLGQHGVLLALVLLIVALLLGALSAWIAGRAGLEMGDSLAVAER